jgi:GNAT superfamily N-acetyltransferase
MEFLTITDLADSARRALFHQVAQQVYAADSAWAPQSEAMFERLLATASQSGVQVWAVVCLEEPLPLARQMNPLARATAILHPRAAPRAAPQGYIGFFECLPGAESAGKAVLERCEQTLRTWGAKSIQAPRVDNQLMGLLVKGFDLPQSVFTPHNPPAYHALLLECGYREVERLYTYRFTRDSVQMLEKALSLLAGASFSGRGAIHTRPFDRNKLEREVQALNSLQRAVFQSHAGYVPRSLEEDRAMVEGFLPLLDDDLVIFAENQAGEPVGLLICLPDFYQATPGKPATAARLISIGALPDWRYKGCGVQMAAHLARSLLQKGYQSLEASWIKAGNPLPQNLARRFGGIPGREFALFEKD